MIVIQNGDNYELVHRLQRDDISTNKKKERCDIINLPSVIRIVCKVLTPLLPDERTPTL